MYYNSFLPPQGLVKFKPFTPSLSGHACTGLAQKTLAGAPHFEAPLQFFLAAILLFFLRLNFGILLIRGLRLMNSSPRRNRGIPSGTETEGKRKGRGRGNQREKGKDRIAGDEIDEKNPRGLVGGKRRVCVYMYIYIYI